MALPILLLPKLLLAIGFTISGISFGLLYWNCVT